MPAVAALPRDDGRLEGLRQALSDEFNCLGKFSDAAKQKIEAIRTLAHEGLVRLLSNRSAQVAELTVEHIEHLFAVVGSLEGLAAEGAVAGGDVVERAAVGQLVAQVGGDAGKVGLLEALHLRLEPVDPVDQRLHALHLTVVLGAEDFLDERVEHGFRSSVRAP